MISIALTTFAKILTACAWLVITVAIHAFGLSALLRVMLRWGALTTSGFPPVARWAIGLTSWLALVHVTEIAVRGLFHFRSGCPPDAESAFCFSGVSYTTVGYGELVLTRSWRMLAPLEALTGILMCGLSTGLFCAFLVRLIGNWMLRTIGSEPHAAAPMAT